jgi:hypothetical protein
LKFLYHNWNGEANAIELVLWIREMDWKGKDADLKASERRIRKVYGEMGPAKRLYPLRQAFFPGNSA